MSDLLKVLDMTEEEQCKFLYDYFKDKYYKTDAWPEWYGICDILLHEVYPGRKITLEHLAFRLRDEAMVYGFRGDSKLTGYSWQYALDAVYKKVSGRKDDIGQHKWLSEKIRPIDMIVAALEAKRLAKENSNGE